MKPTLFVPALLAGLALVSGTAQADKLDDIQKAGVIRISVFDSNPPFGFIDPQTKNWQVMTWILHRPLPMISA